MTVLAVIGGLSLFFGFIAMIVAGIWCEDKVRAWVRRVDLDIDLAKDNARRLQERLEKLEKKEQEVSK